MDDLAEQDRAEATRVGRPNRRATPFPPVDLQHTVFPDAPVQFDDAVLAFKRPVLAGVGGELVQDQADRLDGRRTQDDGRTFQAALPRLNVGGEFTFDRGGELGSLPSAVRQQRVGARQGRDAALHGCREPFLGIGAGQADQGACDRQRVLGAMVHFPGQQVAGVLGGAALADVPQDHRRQMFAADFDMRDGRLDRKFLAIGPQAADGPEGAHLAVGHARLDEVPDMSFVRPAQPFGHEHGERLVDRFFSGQPKHLLGGGIEQDDPVPLVHSDDGVHGRLDDALEPAPCSAKLLIEGRRPLREVAQDDRRQPVGSYRGKRDRSFDREFITVGAQAADRDQGRRQRISHPGLAKAADETVVAISTRHREELRDLGPHGLSGQAPEHQLSSRIEQHDMLALIHRDHRILHRSQYSVEAYLILRVQGIIHSSAPQRIPLRYRTMI